MSLFEIVPETLVKAAVDSLATARDLLSGDQQDLLREISEGETVPALEQLERFEAHASDGGFAITALIGALSVWIAQTTKALPDTDLLRIASSDDEAFDWKSGAYWPVKGRELRKLIASASTSAAPFIAPTAVTPGTVPALSEASCSVEAVPHRNDRCPCGSGRKFKRCCRTKLVKLRAYQQNDPNPEQGVAGLLVSNDEIFDEVSHGAALGESKLDDIGTPELMTPEEQARSSWAAGTAPADIVRTLSATPGWTWYATPTNPSSSLSNPLVAGGVALLKTERGSAEPPNISRQLRAYDKRINGARLREIGSEEGTSREAVRQDIEKLCSAAMHPSTMWWVVKFWDVWTEHYSTLCTEGELLISTVGEGASVLHRGTASPGWGIYWGHAQLWQVCYLGLTHLKRSATSRPYAPIAAFHNRQGQLHTWPPQGPPSRPASPVCH